MANEKANYLAIKLISDKIVASLSSADGEWLPHTDEAEGDWNKKMFL